MDATAWALPFSHSFASFDGCRGGDHVVDEAQLISLSPGRFVRALQDQSSRRFCTGPISDGADVVCHRRREEDDFRFGQDRASVWIASRRRDMASHVISKAAAPAKDPFDRSLQPGFPQVSSFAGPDKCC